MKNYNTQIRICKEKAIKQFKYMLNYILFLTFVLYYVFKYSLKNLVIKKKFFPYSSYINKPMYTSYNCQIS